MTNTETAYLPPDGQLERRHWRSAGSSRSLQQWERQARVSRERPLSSGNQLAAGRRSSAREGRPSPASLRRLSWRRKAPAPGRALQSGLRLVQVAQMAQLRRRLSPSGSTFSISSSEHYRRRDSATEQPFISPSQVVTRLDDWLRNGFREPEPLKIRQRSLGFRWSLRSGLRGCYGETLVHILIVNQTNEHLILLVVLLHLFPMLVYDVFESDKFKGLSCLHLSIAHSNERLLGYLLAESALIERRLDSSSRRPLLLLTQRVTGSLFRSPIGSSSTAKPRREPRAAWLSRLSALLCRRRQQQSRNKVASSRASDDDPASANSDEAAYWCDRMHHWPTANGHTHLILFDRILARKQAPPQSAGKPLEAQDDEELRSGAPIYLGDTPLAWSVSFQKRSIYQVLVTAGANQDAQDAEGNSCLHQVVVNNQTGWTRFLVKSGANASLRNGGALTPLHLACHLGRFILFSELLELSAVEFWSYSMISCCGYPLTDLDSISASEGERAPSKKQVSAMSVILESAESSNEQKSQLLSSPVVKKLLEEKWSIYARRLFYNELLLLLVHLFFLSLSISLRPMASRVAPLLVAEPSREGFLGGFRFGETLAQLWLDRQRWVSITIAHWLPCERGKFTPTHNASAGANSSSPLPRESQTAIRESAMR